MTKKKLLKRKIKVALKRKGKIFKRSITKKRNLISEKFNTSIKGKKIDIRCDCCEHINNIPRDFNSIKKEKCFGKKSAYMIEKVINEIVLAKLRRERDGTYSA